MKDLSKSKRYQKTRAYSTQERLPIGGYVLKILDAQYRENDWGDTIVLSFDIAEGPQKDFFRANYNAQSGEDKKWKGVYRLPVPADDGTEQDEWRMRRFKTVIEAFEDSNPGYRWEWEEQTLKNKTIGALFNNKEYNFNGRHGFFTNCHSLISADRIRSGNYTIPDDTLLRESSASSAPKPSPDGFVSVPDGIDEELPF